MDTEIFITQATEIYKKLIILSLVFYYNFENT